MVLYRGKAWGTVNHLTEEPEAAGSMARCAVIFDWGGVLMRTIDYRPRLAWDERLSLRPGTVESTVHGLEAWRQAQLGRMSSAAYWRAVGAALGLDQQQIKALRADFYSGDRLDESLVHLIRDLRAQGVRVGLLSNYSADLADMLADLDLTALFDAVVISADLGAMKPSPAAYQAVLTELGIVPERALFVDDMAANVEGAAVLGIRAIHFTPELDLRALVEAWLSEMAAQ